MSGGVPRSARVGVGAIVIRKGRVLLVQRGIEPSRGLWAIPGGSLELGETIQEGAEREILEETGIVIRAGDPVHTFDFFERDQAGRIRFHYVIVDVTAEYVSGDVRADDDAQMPAGCLRRIWMPFPWRATPRGSCKRWDFFRKDVVAK